MLADEVEAGAHGKVLRTALVLIRPEGSPTIFGYGKTDGSKAFEDLHRGALELLHMRMLSEAED